MEELLDYIVKQLVTKPEDVKIEMTENGKQIDMVVHVASEDLGAVIGRGGKVANSIRSVVRTAAKKQNKFVNIKFGE